jgi:hypothetical protein
MPSASAARATASASMRSDLPRSRLARRELAISRVGTRTTRSPRAIRNRSKEPETWRQSSSAQTRSTPRARAHCSTWSNPRAPDRRRLVTEHLARRRRDTGDGVRALVHVRTEHDHRCVPFCSWLKWTAGGHGLLRALPRSFQVTPDIPDRRRATQQKEVRRTGPTASKRVSSPPVGTFSSTSDVTDTAKSQQQASKRQPTRGSAGAFAALPLLERRVAQITAGARWWPTSSVRAWRGRWR